MDLLRRAVVATIACSWLFLSGCGGTYRPIASILPLAAGNPQLADTVAVFNVNPNTASDATGSLSVFNVNGDSNVGNFSIGANNLLATAIPPVIPLTSRLITFAGSNSFIATADTQGHAVTVIDTLELTTTKASLPQDLVPTFITATATTGKILVSMKEQVPPSATLTCGGKGAIGIIDPTTATQTNTICAGSAPGFILVAQNDTKAFILDATDNSVSVLNIAAATLSAAPLGVHTNPIWATTSLAGNTIYVLNQGSHDISVIDAVAESVTTLSIASTLLSNPSVIIADNSNRLYISNANLVGTVSVLNASTLAAVHAPIAVGANPVALSVTPDGNSVYVANTGTNFASVINANSFNVTALTPTTDVSARIQSVTVSKDGTKAFIAVTVSNDLANGIYVVFTSNNAFVTNPSGTVLNVAPPQDMSCDATESCSGVLLQRPVQIVPRI
jgi:YVTN family beta-propeller protein